MTTPRSYRDSARRAVRLPANTLRILTTQEFAALHDHARLPWRFFGRFTASIVAGLSRA